MKERHLTKADFVTTRWAGGETTQLFIFPENAVLAERNFKWRISSAGFTSTESRFSDFTGYQRYILPLKGELQMAHQGLFQRSLQAFEVAYFDGSWTTDSKNSPDCIDYNFIVSSACDGKLQMLDEGSEYLLRKNRMASFYALEDFELECESIAWRRKIPGGDLFLLETEAELPLKVHSSGPVILTEVGMD